MDLRGLVLAGYKVTEISESTLKQKHDSTCLQPALNDNIIIINSY